MGDQPHWARGLAVATRKRSPGGDGGGGGDGDDSGQGAQEKSAPDGQTYEECRLLSCCEAVKVSIALLDGRGADGT